MNVLYHASPDKHLALIEPRKTISKDKYIGDYVFATADKRLAAMYLATKGTPILLNIKSKKPRVIICAKQEEYLLSDKGGAIYTLYSHGFKKTPQLGLEESERVSGISVKPLNKEIYATSIAAMLKLDIDIFFVSEQQFKDIVENKQEDEIISKFTPFRQ